MHPLALVLALGAIPVPVTKPPPATCSMFGFPSPYPFGTIAGAQCNQCSPGYAALGTCPNGLPPTCVTQPTCPGQPCAKMSWLACSNGLPITGIIRPKWYVTHVVYGPPGKSSTVNYTGGSTVGSTITLDAESKTQISVKTTATAGAKELFGMSLSYNYGQTWDDTQTNGQDISIAYSNGYQKPGEGNSVDHRWDEVWFLVKPIFNVSVMPAQGWPINQPQAMTWGFGTDAQTQHYFLYVGELTGEFPLDAGVKTAIDGLGLTPADFKEMLKADPLYKGTVPNQQLDSARFGFVTQLVYQPPLAAGAQPDKQTYSVSRSQTSTKQNKAVTTFNVGIDMQASAGLPLIFSVSADGNFQATWTNTTTTKQTQATSSQESVTVAQPDFGYAGPTILRVYEDLMWHTYVFALDWN